MSTYVMSDLHGEMDRFDKMLERIRFSDGDTLYVLGDVVDRGDWGVELLTRILSAPNMILLLGNHEYMCLQYHSPEATEPDIRRWNRNRNTPTLEGLARLDPGDKAALLERLRHLPTHADITVGGVRYYLVHGFPGANLHDEVWGRPEPDTPNPLPDCRLVLGHTPVLELGTTEEEQSAMIRRLEEACDHLRILHAPGFIDIDCSCGYPVSVRRLACLRLDDLAEFYT